MLHLCVLEMIFLDLSNNSTRENKRKTAQCSIQSRPAHTHTHTQIKATKMNKNNIVMKNAVRMRAWLFVAKSHQSRLYLI